MKIKTKLQLIIICNILILVGIVSVRLLWQKQADRQFKRQALVMELNQAIFERAQWREEYFLYREDRSKEQFLLIHKQIGGLIERMLGTFTGLEEKVFLNNMTGCHMKIGAYFNQLVRLDQSATVHTATAQALRERIISQMLMNADLLYREGLRLVNAANEKTVYQNNLAHLYSNIVFGLLALFIVTFAVIIIRSVTYPLTRLHKGTEIIAEGNLDYKTNIRTPDEIGQLSTAFDRMTENLKKTTVSRDELSKEIEIRKRAEEEQRLSRETAERLAGETAVIADIGRIISSAVNIAEVYERFAEAVRKVVPFDRIVINIIDVEMNTVINVYMAGHGITDRIVGVSYPLKGSGNFEMVRTKSSLLIQTEDFDEYKDRFPMLLSTFQAGFRSIMNIPFFSKGEIVGGLLLRSFKPHAYTDHDVRLAERVGNQIAGAIANAQLFTELKKTEEGLRLTRFCMERASDALFWMTPDARIVDVNKAACFSLGYTREELLQLTVPDVDPHYNREKWPQHFVELRQRGSLTFESEQRTRDGRLIPVEIVANHIQFGTEELNCAFVRDITERKRAEKVLEERRLFIETLINLSPDIIYIYDIIERKNVYTNDGIQKILGYSVREVQEMGEQLLLILIHPEDFKTYLEETYPKYCKVKDNEPVIHQYRMKHKNGKWYWLDCSEIIYLREPDGAPRQIFGVVHDITERKRVEEALRESEARYRQLVDNTDTGFVVIDDKGIVITANEPYQRIAGAKGAEDLIGHSVIEWTAPDEQENNAKAVALCARQGFIKDFETVYQHGDGTRVCILIDATMHKSPEGGKYIIAFCHNITDRKQAEEERRNLETKLQRAQKMEAIGLMAGGVAHDLNNMLTAFVSLPELILMDIPEENQKLRREIQMIMSSGQRTAAIVDDLLTITRGVAMARDVLNLNKVVQEYMHSPEFQKLRQFHPSAEVVTELADDLLPIRGSRVHLMKTLMNLVSNASEAIRTSDLGVVSVSTQNRYVDTPLEGYERVNIGEYAVLVVKDNGMGIFPEDMERIFEPFYTKKVMGRSGTGLGLSVVWNTVTDHAGYIHVESGDGGTVFELYFPITRESVSELEKPLDLEQYKGRGEKVLVVDDELDQRVIAMDMLRKLGYQAEAVSGGQEALEFLREHEVDILLLDMVMPGMDGYDTFSRIVQIKPGQKAVIASGFSMSDRVKKAQELGAGAYIRKPYSVEKLGMAIKTELARQG